MQELNKKLRKDKEDKTVSTVIDLESKDDDKELIYEDGDDIICREDKDDDIDVVAVTSSISTVDDKIAWLIGNI